MGMIIEGAAISGAAYGLSRSIALTIFVAVVYFLWPRKLIEHCDEGTMIDGLSAGTPGPVPHGAPFVPRAR